MSSAAPNNFGSAARPGEDWRAWYPPPVAPRQAGGSRWGLLVAGLAAVGLGIVAWHYVGADIKRYIRISNM
jgi:hypothetical protein